MYFSKGCIEPVVFYKRMAALKSGIPAGEDTGYDILAAPVWKNAEKPSLSGRRLLLANH